MKFARDTLSAYFDIFDDITLMMRVAEQRSPSDAGIN